LKIITVAWVAVTWDFWKMLKTVNERCGTDQDYADAWQVAEGTDRSDIQAVTEGYGVPLLKR